VDDDTVAGVVGMQVVVGMSVVADMPAVLDTVADIVVVMVLQPPSQTMEGTLREFQVEIIQAAQLARGQA